MKKLLAIVWIVGVLCATGCASGTYRTIVRVEPTRNYAIGATPYDGVYLVLTKDRDIGNTPGLDEAMDYLGCGPCSVQLELDGMIWLVNVLEEN